MSGEATKETEVTKGRKLTPDQIGVVVECVNIKDYKEKCPWCGAGVMERTEDQINYDCWASVLEIFGCWVKHAECVYPKGGNHE